MFNYLPIGGSRLWTPKSPGNLLAWYDARVGVTVDGSNNVTSWSDQSGNGYTLNNSGTGPEYSATSWNGTQPSLLFHGLDEGGSGNLLINTGGLATYVSSGSHANPVTVLLITEISLPAGVGNDSAIITWDDSPTLGNICNYYISNNQHAAISYGGAVLKVEGTIPVNGAKKVIGYMTGSDGYFDSYVNASLDMNHTGPLVITMNNSVRVLVGMSWTGVTSSYSGKIAELIVYSKKLTSTEYFDFYNYAKLKWGGL